MTGGAESRSSGALEYARRTWSRRLTSHRNEESRSRKAYSERALYTKTSHVVCFLCARNDDSIFAPRRKEAESRSFWDTERVTRKALDADYGRMLKEDRVLKLIAKSDAEVAKGQKTAKESLEEVTTIVYMTYVQGT